MPAIIPKADLQRNAEAIEQALKNSAYAIVTKKGRGKYFVFEYVEGVDDVIDRFLEDVEMYANKEKLQKKWQASIDSGLSDLII